ncbi:MAG: hypothetical protein DMG78_10130 [Acidobacteria bacterium]|nr:MAG: hypothetical protein DMG78_10130 [Acidobacteriota bacterium]
MCRLVWLFCVLLAFTAFSAAQVTPPPGWTVQSTGGAAILFSPGEPSSRVALTLLPPGSPIGNVKSWFGNQALALAQASGHTLGATDVTEEEGILLRVVQVENQNHMKLRMVFYGYRSARGFSIPILMIPPRVSDQDPRLETANQYVQQLAAQKFELSAAPEAATQPEQPATGWRPKTDIDLTYHAKAIIPKDRDVPLKGVYVFVGYAFGPSYGGVGTTMTWGQRATQQLLLLFANGVAAKTDLKGDNLAGHHQAEGFATMDVANPAAVAGAPYGHWTDNADTIHIQWNIGAPTDLAKKGNTLEGKGERWTPFQLVEGERMEGTFVRKMEAGLRSQWIVLHKNGTFEGDGVNVTMGGEIVSPNFPAHGSGTYEVHKGSMILFFQNGFTQAIACIIDAAPNGDARTVLLNGFPFERVR